MINDLLLEAGVVLKGHFLLSSGLHSDTYLQCAKIFEDTNLSEKICKQIAINIEQKFGKNAFDIVVAPAMGGVLFGYEIAKQTKINKNIFLERVDGQFELRRGFQIPEGAKILIAEDVITTGKSSLEVYNLIKNFKPSFIAECCVFDRRENDEEYKLPFDVVHFEKLVIKTFKPDNIPVSLQSIPAIKPGSRNLKK